MKELKYHYCTVEDYAKFFEPDKKVAKTVAKIQAEPESMICIDE